MPRRRKRRTPVGYFQERSLPEMVEVGGEMVAGPFCKHCGYPVTMHGPKLECREDPNALMGPICDCHYIEQEEGKRGRIVRGTPEQVQAARERRRAAARTRRPY